MKILSIHIENFGGLHDYHLELPAGLEVICQPNGTGKTTVANFLTAMLYGMRVSRVQALDENPRKKFHPWQQGAYGGSMTFVCRFGSFRLERFFALKESGDQMKVFNTDTGKETDLLGAVPGETLFGIDLDGFTRSIWLSASNGGLPKSSGGSVTARLAQLMQVSNDLADYDSAMKALEKTERRYKTTGERGEIPTGEREIAACRRKLEESRKAAEELAGLETQIAERVQRIAQGEALAQSYGKEINDANILASELSVNANHAAAIEAQLAEKLALCGDIPPTPEEAAGIRELTAEWKRLQSEKNTSPPNPAISLQEEKYGTLPSVEDLNAAVLADRDLASCLTEIDHLQRSSILSTPTDYDLPDRILVEQAIERNQTLVAIHATMVRSEELKKQRSEVESHFRDGCIPTKEAAEQAYTDYTDYTRRNTDINHWKEQMAALAKENTQRHEQALHNRRLRRTRGMVFGLLFLVFVAAGLVLLITKQPTIWLAPLFVLGALSLFGLLFFLLHYRTRTVPLEEEEDRRRYAEWNHALEKARTANTEAFSRISAFLDTCPEAAGRETGLTAEQIRYVSDFSTRYAYLRTEEEALYTKLPLPQEIENIQNEQQDFIARYLQNLNLGENEDISRPLHLLLERVQIEENRKKSYAELTEQLRVCREKESAIRSHLVKCLGSYARPGEKSYADIIRDLREKRMAYEQDLLSYRANVKEQESRSERLRMLSGQLTAFLQRHGGWQGNRNDPFVRIAEILSAAEQIPALQRETARIAAEATEIRARHTAPRATEEELRMRIAGVREKLEKDRTEKEILMQKKQELFILATQVDDLQSLLESLQAENARKQQKYDAILSAEEFLSKAKDALTARYLGRMQVGFREACETLGGRTLGCTVDADLGLHVVGAGSTRDPASLSQGQRDLVGFCLRLALADALFPEETPFLVLDDPFVNLDDEKLALVRNKLQILAEKWQILYLVCSTSRE